MLKLDKPAPYPISYDLKRDDTLFVNAEKAILACLNESFEEVEAVLAQFSQFAFLYEKSSDRVVSHLFPEKKAIPLPENKDKKDVKAGEAAARIHIMDLEKQEILNKLLEFKNAKESI